MLSVGTNVQYYSVHHTRWLPASILAHRSDGSYVLDVNSHADPKKVRLRDQSAAEYNSSTHGGWIPAIVKSIDQDFDYILDVHPKASPAKVRPRQVEALKCFIVGGKTVWAENVQEALAKSAQAAEDGNDLAGFKQIKSFNSLPQDAKQYHNLLYTLANKGGNQLLRQEATKSFKRFDKNGDGKISVEELKDLCTNIAKKLTLPPVDPILVRDLFHRYDLNRSGFIEEAEFPFLFRRVVRRMLAEMKVASQQHLLRASKQKFSIKYELGKRIAAGAQGVTFLAKDRRSGETVVVKKPNQAGDIDDFEKLQQKTHPNIVKVIELFDSPAETYVVMEFCAGGDLFHALKHVRDNFGSATMNFCAKAMHQVLVGVAYIHQEFKECHNDIKPENILLDRKPTSVSDVPRIMLADFGCASGLGKDCDGDPRYNAPELWQGLPVTYETDVWALGVVLYEMLSGGLLIFTDHPNISGWQAWCSFQGGVLLQILQSRIASGAQPDWRPILPCGNDAVQLCQSMLTRDPSRRITTSAALESPWVKTEHDPNFSLPDEIVDKLRARAEMSDMKILLLNLIASKIQGEQLEFYEKLWNEVDKDRNGTLSRDEFVTMLEAHSFSRSKAEDVFYLADLDGSGSVNFNEFVAVMFNPDIMSSQQLQSQCMFVFGYMFQGKVMSFQEFTRVFPGDASRDLLAGLFRSIDRNNNGKVSLDEFVDFVSQM